ncbi:MAG: hypothetical protein ACKO2G_01360 [Verrucomicrobiales bacterium]
MKKPTLTAIAGFWLITVAGAFYMGQHRSAEANKPSGQSAGQPGSSGSVSVSSGSGSSASVNTKSSSPWTPGGGGGATGAGSAQALAKLKASFSNLNSLDRQKAFLEALDGLDNEGFKEAHQLLRSQDDWGTSRYQSSMLFYAWGRKDPEAALAYTAEVGSERANFSILSSWAEVAPSKAIEWAKANAPVDENGNPQENWNMVGAVHGLAKTDLGQAASALESMNFGEARGNALDVVFAKMWKQDPEQTKTWINSIGDERLQAGVAVRIADRLADSDPKVAATWIESLTQPQAKARAAADIIEKWSGQDPNATGDWVNRNFPANQENDRVREAFAYSIDHRDPQSSLAWAGTITDQGRRDETVTRIAREWLRRDAQNARAVLETMPNLPQNVKERLNRQ